MYKARDVAYIGILAALNSVSEVFIGGSLYILGFYFKGTIMIGINLLLYVITREMVNKRGDVLAVAFITAFLRFAFLGQLSAALGIFIEGIIVEVVFDILRADSKGCIVAGALANTWTLFHPFLIGIYILGPERVLIYNKVASYLIQKGYSGALFLGLFYPLSGAMLGFIIIKAVSLFKKRKVILVRENNVTLTPK